MATLQEIRQKFIERSGRIDLATDGLAATTDNGADWFINAGQRFLDRELPDPNATLLSSHSVSAGDYAIEIARLRAPLEVWRVDGDGARVCLVRLTLDGAKRLYGQSFASIEAGTPAAWCVARNIASATPSTNLSVYILPPTEEATTIEVMGTYYTADLSANADVSYWSERHPDLLILAALYQLEISMRNTEGSKDWLLPLQRALLTIDHDNAQSESVDKYELEG